MTITIDNALVAEAQAVLGVSTKADAIRIALQEVLRRRRRANALARQGKVRLALDQEALQRLRETR